MIFCEVNVHEEKENEAIIERNGDKDIFKKRKGKSDINIDGF